MRSPSSPRYPGLLPEQPGYFFVGLGLGDADGDADGLAEGVGVKAAPELSTNDLNWSAFATLPV